ncbi:MAG TPA: hypothetical protein VFD38_19805 [Myxococcaceae bacterium]|nr:hypothetical protein [Myxococcaceae bacterium]
MTAPRLASALALSAAVHLAVLAGLLALAHPRAPAPPAMRVALVEPAGMAGGRAPSGAPGAGHEAPGRGEVDARLPRASLLEGAGTTAAPRATPATGATAGLAPGATTARPGSRSFRTPEARETTAEVSGARSASDAVALVTPVQSDLWVLGAPVRSNGPEHPSAAATAGGPGASGAASPESVAGAPAAIAASGAEGEGPGGESASGSTGAGGASLLAVLSQRLAWSAQRCAPPSVVRTARHAVPGVPLRFCLDAAGRPSEVGLLGTTGSDQLDRAARDCVIPGALPLPPVPGCYTVEVRFPTRG